MPSRPSAPAERSGCLLLAIPLILLWVFHPHAPWWHWVSFGMVSVAIWDVAEKVAER